MRPICLMKARTGYRLGSGELVDSMIHDGLWDVYNQFHMGAAAEICARMLKIGREEQDEFAADQLRAGAARPRSEGALAREIVAVTVPQDYGQTRSSPKTRSQSALTLASFRT